MKKTYICPAATVIAFDTEKSMATVMVGSQKGESITQDDDWSNERQWDGPAWGAEEELGEE